MRNEESLILKNLEFAFDLQNPSHQIILRAVMTIYLNEGI